MSDFGDGLPVGAGIEEFEIVRELGRGGFGITYLARDRALDRLVAVKEYFPVDWSMRQAGGSIRPRSTTMVSDYAWGLEKFVAEARVLARLDHPGIVRVHRIVQAGGSAYMAMEHIDGHSLADELLKSGPLPAPRVHRLLQRLAEGLAEVHAAGLLHRDVKPANVMLRARDGSPVLIDFGAARQQMGQQSRSITAVLTPGYAPIEQYSPKGRQGPWTDVYALGALGYAALTGRVPDDATVRVTGATLRPVGEVAPSPLSGELAGAVMAALATDSRERPQGMAEWMGLLGGTGKAPADREAGAATGDPRSERRVSEADDPVRAGRKKDPGTIPSERRRAPQRAASSPKPSGRRFGTAGPKGPLWIGGGAAAVAMAALLVWLAGGRSGGNGGAPTESVPSDLDSVAAAVEEALGLERSEVQRIQRGLLEAGFDPAEGDGLMGVGTREALRSWQAARGFEVTGYLGANAADALEHTGLEAFQADTAAEQGRLAEQARIVEQARLAEEARRAEAERQTEAARRAEQERLAEERRPGRVFQDCSGCPQMVVVPAGTFAMGSPESEAGREDHEGLPRYRTIAEPFAVGVHEVTFAEWDACARGGGCGGRIPDDEGWGRGDRPVINVNWDDAVAYTRWLSRRTGREYRLPSVVEREYAARAGTETARHWGEGESGQCRYANGEDASYKSAYPNREINVTCSDGYGRSTAPVGTFLPNGWGLYDMLGNVWEWTGHCWDVNSIAHCTYSGGSWNDEPEKLRSASSYGASTGFRYFNLGFRVVRTVN